MATPGELIPDLLQELKDMGDSIEEEIYTICIYSGCITREEAFRMSYKERRKLAEILQKKAKQE